MNNGAGAFSIRRILAAVDASPNSLDILETAAILASGLRAELSGIFVEDINLLRLAGLPFARELAWSSSAELHLDYQRMERVLRGRAAHAQQAVVSITTQLKVHSTLQIVRGHVVQELLRAAEGMDLLILGKAGASPGKKLGNVAQRMALEAPCSVLLLADKGKLRHGPVMVPFAGLGPAEERLLGAAAQIARLEQNILLVAIPAQTEGDYRHLQNQARRLLGEGSLAVSYQAVKSPDARCYQRLIEEEGVGLMVLAGDREEIAGLENKLAALDCSILVVR